MSIRGEPDARRGARRCQWLGFLQDVKNPLAGVARPALESRPADKAHRPPAHCATGGDPMTWETPAFVEIKMDAEINSYQEDEFDGI